MSTQNICFRREIKKYRYFLVEKSILQRAMLINTCIGEQLASSCVAQDFQTLMPKFYSGCILMSNKYKGQRGQLVDLNLIFIVLSKILVHFHLSGCIITAAACIFLVHVLAEALSLTLYCWTWICPVWANNVDPDQLASEEANWSGSTLFDIKYVNLY